MSPIIIRDIINGQSTNVGDRYETCVFGWDAITPEQNRYQRMSMLRKRLSCCLGSYPWSRQSLDYWSLEFPWRCWAYAVGHQRIDAREMGQKMLGVQNAVFAWMARRWGCRLSAFQNGPSSHQLKSFNYYILPQCCLRVHYDDSFSTTRQPINGPIRMYSVELIFKI